MSMPWYEVLAAVFALIMLIFGVGAAIDVLTEKRK